MREKYKLEEVKEFAENHFVNYKSEVQFDEPFIDGLSNIAKSLIKYLVYKQAFEEEKFLFQIDDFNRFMRYINIDYPSDGIV